MAGEVGEKVKGRKVLMKTAYFCPQLDSTMTAVQSTNAVSGATQLLFEGSVWSPYDSYEAAEVMLQAIKNRKLQAGSPQPRLTAR